MTKIENLWKIYESTSELIRFSDTKATAILAINGVIAGFFFSNISSLKDILIQKPIATIPFIFTIIFVISSSLFSLKSLIPRLRTGMGCNLVFFADIIATHKNSDEYFQAITKAHKEEDGMHSQLSNEIWAISHIAKTKFQDVKKAVVSLTGVILSIIIFGILAI